MTIEEAWKIIEACKNWNASQKSLSLAFGGVRTAEDDIYDARRSALAQAWRVVASCSGRSETDPGEAA